MRALTRMRTLAAACALLLFVSGMAAAWAPTRPIDRTDSPPPPMVGDPDQPTGGMVAIYGYWFVFLRVPSSWAHLLTGAPRSTTSHFNSALNSRAGHAR